jgi:hypothetical protein
VAGGSAWTIVQVGRMSGLARWRLSLGAGTRQTAGMASLHDAQLSALSAGIDDLARRAASLAEELQAREAEAGAAMFEVERSLMMATRSLERARRALSA